MTAILVTCHLGQSAGLIQLARNAPEKFVANVDNDSLANVAAIIALPDESGYSQELIPVVLREGPKHDVGVRAVEETEAIGAPFVMLIDLSEEDDVGEVEAAD